jgi:hypothetical protein
MISCSGNPASLNASQSNTRVSATLCSLSQSHQLISGQCQDTEHQMSHHFSGPLDHQVLAAELILESGIAALGNGTLVISNHIRRLERLFLARGLSSISGM